MKRLIILVALVVLVAGLVLSGVIDPNVSMADTSVPGTEGTSSVAEIDNPNLASAVIIIT